MSFWKKLLYRVIYPSSLLFTVISLFVYIIFATDSNGDFIMKTQEVAMMFFILLAYSLFVAFVSCIFFTEIILPLKYIIHFGSLFITLWIASKRVLPTTYYIILIIFVAVYLVIAIPATIVYGKKQKAKNEKKDYKKVFSK